MNNVIYLYTNISEECNPINIFVSKKSTLENLPYFKFLIDKYPTYGTRKNPLFVDLDYDCLYHIIEYLRCNKFYNLPSIYINIWNKLDDSTLDDIYELEDIIIFNIGGELFKSLKSTLTKSHYFESLLNRWDVNMSEFIDKSPVTFRHILSFLRNSEYSIPKEYIHELDFYGIGPINQSIGWNGYSEYMDCVDYMIKNKCTDIPQLCNIGKQDEFITGDSDNFLFSHKQSKYTHFADTFKISKPDLISSFADEQKIRFYLDFREHHLINNSYLVIDIENLHEHKWINPKMLVYRLVKNIFVSTGSTIDKISGEYVYIKQQLFNRNDYDLFVNRFTNKYLILPIYMFFYDYQNSFGPGINSPLFFVELRKFADLVYDDKHNVPKIDISLITNCVSSRIEDFDKTLLLSRRQFVKQSLLHEIEFQDHKFEKYLNFNNPVSEIIFVIEDADNEPMDYFYHDNEEPLISCKLIINDKLVTNITNPLINTLYFSKTKLPPTDQPIYILPFSLNPGNSLQPSGTFNIDRSEKSCLQFHVKPRKGIVKLWVVTCNWLEYVKGMSGFNFTSVFDI